MTADDKRLGVVSINAKPTDVLPGLGPGIHDAPARRILLY